jgi:hypothetical protein
MKEIAYARRPENAPVMYLKHGQVTVKELVSPAIVAPP